MIPNMPTAPLATSNHDHDLMARLELEATSHPAVRHPWLARFAAGEFTDFDRVVRDFAAHYHGYSAWFTRYLEAVIGKLTDPGHRELLEENLAEEKGVLGADDRATLRAIGIAPESVEGIAHSELFRRFCQSTGLTAADLATPSPATIRWRSEFLTFLRGASPAAAVGALGLGTESIVATVYTPIVEGLRRHSSLRREDYVFFELHCFVDDQHQLDLQQVATELARDAKGRTELRRGMLAALELRRAFFDHLLEHTNAGHQAVSA